MRYVTVDDVLRLHARVRAHTGGGAGLRDAGALASAVAQPHLGFGGAELYPTPAEKAAALAHALVLNHPFVDGNKRVGHAAMEVFLVFNGYEIEAEVAAQEALFLALAAGTVAREALARWIAAHVVAYRRRTGA